MLQYITDNWQLMIIKVLLISILIIVQRLVVQEVALNDIIKILSQINTTHKEAAQTIVTSLYALREGRTEEAITKLMLLATELMKQHEIIQTGLSQIT